MWSRVAPSCLLVTLLTNLSVSGANRRPLDHPDVIYFSPADHFNAAYKAILESLTRLGGEAASLDIEEHLRTLLSTLDERDLLQAANRLEDAILMWRANLDDVDEIRSQLLAQTQALMERIESGHYVRGAPVDIQVDEENRVYRVTWREWEGDNWGRQVEREVPFVPRMRVTVIGSYDPNRGGGAYGYIVDNAIESQAAAGELRIQAVGLTEAHGQVLPRWPNHTSIYLRNNEYLVRLVLPGRKYLQDFGLFSYKDNKRIIAQPGEKIRFEPVLSVPWPQLPGIVKCWVEVWNYHHALDAHQDPENVLEIFARGSTVLANPSLDHPKSIPRYAYHGQTIGPVPLPEKSITSEQFVSTIKEYLTEANTWAWISKSYSRKL